LCNSYSKQFWTSPAAGGSLKVQLRVAAGQQQEQQQEQHQQQQQELLQQRLQLQQAQQQNQQHKQNLKQTEQELIKTRLHLQQQQLALKQQLQELEQLRLPQQQKIQEINNQFHQAARYVAPIAHGDTYSAILKDATLSSWEAKVSHNSTTYCRKGAWNDLTSGSWYTTLDGELLYEPSSCKLRRLSADAARQCLSNKTLTFVGDSLSRYQYLSLAYFLTHGRYMQRYGTDGINRTLAHEMTWANFTIFYSEGSKLLQRHSAAINVTEACDCYRIRLDHNVREDRTLTVDALIPAAPGQAANRSSALVASQLKVGYRQAFGMKTNVLNETMAAIQRAAQDNSTAESIMLVNLGHWFNRGMADNPNTYRAVAAVYEPLFATAAATAAAGRGKAQIIWKSTTSFGNPRLAKEPPAQYDWHSLLTSMARHYRWTVMDAFGVTLSMTTSGVYGFWDALHYHAFVYDQLNDVLLNGLC
jgi:hypothetical protein